jgi:hypothetical protein
MLESVLDKMIARRAGRPTPCPTLNLVGSLSQALCQNVTNGRKPHDTLVRPIYGKLGASDNAAKGSEMVAELKLTLKSQCAKKTEASRMEWSPQSAIPFFRHPNRGAEFALKVRDLYAVRQKLRLLH